MQQINLRPPVDPDGNQVLREGLLISKEDVEGMIHRAQQRMFLWIISFKTATKQITETEAKQLIFDSIKELDENLREQWP